MEQDLIYIWDNGQEYSAHETYFIKSDLTKHQVENIFDITEMSIGLIGIVKSLDWRTSFSSMQYLLFHEISHKLELAQLGFGWKDTCPVAIKQKEKEDAFKYGLCEPIISEFHKKISLPKASSITVNKVHGNEKTIKVIQEKYNADTENMEGLAFYYVMKLINKPSIEIRSISNYVERRNKDNWQIKNAVDNLNKEIIALLS